MRTMLNFLTVDEVSSILRVSKRTAYGLCRSGQIGGATKVGNQWRVEKAAFEAWVKQGGGSVSSPAPTKKVRP